MVNIMTTNAKKSTKTIQPETEVVVNEELQAEPVVEETLTELVNEEVVALTKEIEDLKELIKEKNKRIRELNKKPGQRGMTKKDQALAYFKEHDGISLNDFVIHCITKLGVSPVYSSTCFKEFSAKNG